MKVRRLVLMWSFALGGLAASAASAQASVYCVGVSGGDCTNIVSGGTPGLNLDAAISSAVAHGGADTVRLGPGDYLRSSGYTINGTEPTAIVGPTTGVATLRADSTGTTVLINGSNVQLSNVTVNVPSLSTTSQGIESTSTTQGLALTDVRVVDPTPSSGSAANTPEKRVGILVGGGTLSSVTVQGPRTGVVVSGNATIVGSTITAGIYGVVARDGSLVDIAGSRVMVPTADPYYGEVGISVRAATVRAVGVDISSAGSGVSTYLSGAGLTANTTLTRTTITHGTNPSNTAIAERAENGASSLTTVRDSILTEPAQLNLTTDGNGGAHVELKIGTSRWGGAGRLGSFGANAASSLRVLTQEAGLTTTPVQFVSAADRHLASGSPLIDALPAITSGDPDGTDAAGNFLTRDGNGDGISRQDFGGYENQPPALAVPAGNVLQAPGAEGPGAAPDQTSSPLPLAPWVRTAGNFTVGTYGGTYFPGTTIARAIGGGASFFVGGQNSAESRATQTVDLSNQAERIDAGVVTATLSGLLGGWSGQEDSGVVNARFRDAAGNPLATASIGPVDRDARDSGLQLMPRTTSASVPVGTRSVVVELVATRGAGDPYNDASFDNLALTLDGAVPVSVPVAAPAPVAPLALAPVGASSVFRGIGLPKGKITVSAKGVLRLRVTCPSTAVAGCSGSVLVTYETKKRVTKKVKGKVKKITVIKTKVLATTAVNAGTGAERVLTVKLRRAQRKLITAKGLKVRLRATSQDSLSSPQVTVSRASLRAAKKTARHAKKTAKHAKK